MTNLAAEIVAYLRYEREPIERHRAAREMSRMSRLAALYDKKSDVWVIADFEFMEAMDAMVRSGELIESGGKIRLKPEPKVEKEKQGELF